jgi:recombinational DNA repair protein RecR
MRHYFSMFSCVALLLFSVSAFAGAVIAKDAIPEKILASFNKKHPNAIDVTAIAKKHFGQDLYLIAYKEAKESDTRSIAYYRVNGNFYVNGDEIDTSKTSVEMPPASYENLKTTFGDYDIKEAILVVNPNAAGEEFDLVVTASGATWHIALDRNGNIIQKEE